MLVPTIIAVVAFIAAMIEGSPPLCFVDYKAGEEWHWLPLHPCKSGE